MRRKILTVPLSQKEKAQLQALAEREALPLAATVRRLILQAPGPGAVMGLDGPGDGQHDKMGGAMVKPGPM